MKLLVSYGIMDLYKVMDNNFHTYEKSPPHDTCTTFMWELLESREIGLFTLDFTQ